MASSRSFLEVNGFVVITVPWMTHSKRKAVRAELEDVLTKFREFKSVPERRKYVLGGFSALGNPSSFHNESVRRLREHALVEVLPVMRMEAKPDELLEQLVDRLMIRRAGDTATKESWHRDIAPDALEGDRTYGGWWNLDDHPQYFSCCAGSHNDTLTLIRGKKGYAKTPKDAHVEKTNVEIPPGAIVVFYEHILHEVVARKRDYDVYRLFLGWRLTKSHDSLFPATEQALHAQATMMLKSKQIPPMYPDLIWTNHRKILDEFSTHVRDACRVVLTVQSGKCKGDVHNAVNKHMLSLEAYGLRKYKAYDDRELALYRPGVKWNARSGATGEIVKLRLRSRSRTAVPASSNAIVINLTSSSSK